MFSHTFHQMAAEDLLQDYGWQRHESIWWHPTHRKTAFSLLEAVSMTCFWQQARAGRSEHEIDQLKSRQGSLDFLLVVSCCAFALSLLLAIYK